MSQLQLQDFSALYGVLAEGNAVGAELECALHELSATARERNMGLDQFVDALESAGVTITDATRQWLANDFTQEA